VANYDSTLNKALGDIADRMSSIRSADRQMVSQRVAQNAAQRAYDLAIDRYKAGLTPQVTVLTAESSLLLQEQTRVNIEGARRDQQIGLIKALGGGFDAQAAGLVVGQERPAKTDVDGDAATQTH